ncbi:MAG: M20/M25/M40 family metallo-hydrolase, partial [Melioribacter sp.]|nr:M20/M25/M40 family metallo-hydrolase [Melioribacter sp.]
MKSIVRLSFITILFLTIVNHAQTVDEIYPYLEKLCKEFHQYPELSLQEEITSKRIGEELRKLGFEVTEKVGRYGLVGILKNGEGKKLLIRTDMDALPIDENTGLPFSSNNKGVMHACGHDIHMSVFIGVANILANNKNNWKGT